MRAKERTVQPAWALTHGVSGKICRCVVSLLAFLACWGIPSAQADPDPASSSTGARIKAAAVYNLTKVVRWPSESLGETFVVGLVGDDDGDLDFDSILGRTAAGLPVQLVHIGSDAELALCQIVYVSRSGREEWHQMREVLEDAPVLTISELDGFADSGGIVQLSRRRNRLRFRVNAAAAEEAGLQMSSQFLKIAELVEASR